MADTQKYYYLKLKNDFFESDAMVVLESMQDGYVYSNILLKMYLRSLKDGGRLMLNERIPYNPATLAQVTRHSVGDVEMAVKVFKELGLIEVLDTGAIFISDIQNYIGKSTTEADRIRDYRTRIKSEQKSLTEVVQMYDKSTPEIEREIEKEIEKKKKPVRHKNGEYGHILLTDDQLNKLLTEYSKPIVDDFIRKVDEYCQQHGKTYKDYYLTIRNWINKDNIKPTDEPKRDYKVLK